MILDYDIFPDKRNGGYQVRTKTVSYAIVFDDKAKEQIFLEFIEILKKKSATSFQNLTRKLRKNNTEAKVIDVLHTMNEFQLLPVDYAAEMPAASHPSATKNAGDSAGYPDFSKYSVYILSNGKVGREIKSLLKAEGFVNVTQKAFDDKIKMPDVVREANFLIVDGCEWSPYHIEDLNARSIETSTPWLYLGGIEETAFKIGPLFYGQETGCYNCLISRLKSNHEHPHFLTSYEEYLRINKIASKPDKISNSNIFKNIIANIAGLEVINFFTPWSLPVTWKSVFSFDLASLSTSKHALLKKPFCETCKPDILYNPSPWLEAVTLK